MEVRYPSLWLVLWILGVIFSFLGVFGILGRYIHLHADDRDERMEEGVFYSFISIAIFGWTLMLISGSVQFSLVRGEMKKGRRIEAVSNLGDDKEIKDEAETAAKSQLNITGV